MKIILDNAGGRPCNGDPTDATCEFNTDDEIRERYEGIYGNDLLLGYGRGYTFNVTEIVEVFLDPDDPAMWPPEGLLLVCEGGERDGRGCETSDDCPDGFCRGALYWFEAPIGMDTRDTLELAAMNDFNGQNRFEWRDDCMNVYILHTPESGYGSRYRSGSEHHITIIGQQHAKVTTPFHEAGHYLGLCHTQGCGCGPCSEDPGVPAECNTVPGDDGIDDTLRDLPCWDADDLAMENFAEEFYVNLTPQQQARVDLAMENLMSYHRERFWLTSGQLDRMTDVSNGIRSNITSGRTHFVDATGAPSGGDGSSTDPYASVASGVAASDVGDILLIRHGFYDENLNIRDSVTLRASRGDAVIGASGL